MFERAVPFVLIKEGSGEAFLSLEFVFNTCLVVERATGYDVHRIVIRETTHMALERNTEEYYIRSDIRILVHLDRG